MGLLEFAAQKTCNLKVPFLESQLTRKSRQGASDPREQMKRYSFLQAPFLSFFSKAFYRDVGQHWRGTGLAYLLIILALFWIPSIIKARLGVGRFVDTESKKITEQIPAITISHGKVSTDVPTPYYIRDPDSGTPLAIIDTTGQYRTLDEKPANVLLLTDSKLIMRNERETRTFDLSKVESLYVDRARVEGWLATAKTWFVPVAYPLALLFSFVFRTIQILIYALIGLLFAHLLHANLGYKTLMRLAAMAITPVLVLDLIMDFLPVSLPLWSLLGVGVALAYLFLAVKSNTEREAAPQEPSP
jgi:hypothetical protein